MAVHVFENLKVSHTNPDPPSILDVTSVNHEQLTKFSLKDIILMAKNIAYYGCPPRNKKYVCPPRKFQPAPSP